MSFQNAKVSISLLKWILSFLIIMLLLQGVGTARAGRLEDAAFKAISDRNREAFIATLEAGLDVNATDEVGTSLLMEVSDKFPDLVPRLIKRGADVAYRSPSGGQPPLLEAMTQRNLENVKVLLEAGDTLQGEERRYAQNILSSFPDVEIAKLLGFPTTNEDGSFIDQHAIFSWARDTRYASQVCNDFIEKLRARTSETLTGIGYFDSGQFDPKASRKAVLEEVNQFYSYVTSATFLEHAESEEWLTSTWASDSEYTFMLVGRQKPVFCSIAAIAM